MNTAIGAGTLALPFTFSQMGLVNGIILVSFMGILTSFSLVFVSRVSLATRCNSYPSNRNEILVKFKSFPVNFMENQLKL